jgi:hypothetical protein
MLRAMVNFLSMVVSGTFESSDSNMAAKNSGSRGSSLTRAP